MAGYRPIRGNGALCLIPAGWDVTPVVLHPLKVDPSRARPNQTQPFCFFPAALPRQQLFEPQGVPVADGRTAAQELLGLVEVPRPTSRSASRSAASQSPASARARSSSRSLRSATRSGAG